MRGTNLCLHAPSNGMPISNRTRSVYLQMEINLKSVAEVASTEGVKSTHTWYCQNMFGEVFEHSLVGCLVDEVLAGVTKEAYAFRPQPPGKHETHHLIEAR